MVSTTDITVRRATDGDFDAIARLQDRYLATNLDDAARAGGFLSARFSAEQFRIINDRLGVVLALYDFAVVGFLCGSRVEDVAKQPIVEAMFQAPGMDRYIANTCVAGPVCIDEVQRGKGILARLYSTLAEELQQTGGYERMIIFVDHTNVSSIRAHEKIGFREISKFTRGANNYVAMELTVNRRT